MAGVKSKYRSVFLALQADVKEFPGGISGIASIMGLNATSLGNGINPDHEQNPPAFERILEMITLTQAKRTVFCLAQLVGQVTSDFELEHRPPAESVRLFLSLMQTVSVLLGAGSEAAKDFRFDADERKALEPMLLAVMKSAGEVLLSVRG